MDKNFGLSAGKSGVWIPGPGKCSLRTTAVDARVNYPLYFTFLVALGPYIMYCSLTPQDAALGDLGSNSGSR